MYICIYWLLPSADCRLLCAYCLSQLTYGLLPIAYCLLLLPTACCLLPIAHCPLSIAYCHGMDQAWAHALPMCGARRWDRTGGAVGPPFGAGRVRGPSTSGRGTSPGLVHSMAIGTRPIVNQHCHRESRKSNESRNCSFRSIAIQYISPSNIVISPSNKSPYPV